MNSVLFRALALGGLTLALCTSCEDLDQSTAAAQRARANAARTATSHPDPGYWAGDGMEGAPKIVVHLAEQRAFFYKGKTLVAQSSISTGRKGFETPPGKYRVIQKDENHVSNLYGSYVDKNGTVVQRNVDVEKDPRPRGTEFQGAPMPYFLRFTGGYGMHAGFVPRYRASHGCIRMPLEMARHFFDAVEEDTPVVVEE